MRGRMRKRWVVIALVALLALVILLVRAHSVASSVFLDPPDQLHIVVTRIQSPAGSPQVIFDRQAGAVARQVYAQLVAGTRIPADAPMSCPLVGPAPYYHYQLTFTHAGMRTSVAISDARGCELIELDAVGSSPAFFTWLAPDGTSFWQVLHQLVNAPLPINAISGQLRPSATPRHTNTSV
ncbi:MAG TPA: hypothetical protein VF916_03130 [Ktedonobacterales bacterium]